MLCTDDPLHWILPSAPYIRIRHPPDKKKSQGPRTGGKLAQFIYYTQREKFNLPVPETRAVPWQRCPERIGKRPKRGQSLRRFTHDIICLGLGLYRSSSCLSRDHWTRCGVGRRSPTGNWRRQEKDTAGLYLVTGSSIHERATHEY